MHLRKTLDSTRRATPLPGVIKSHSGDIATAAKEWVERYESDADAALAELFAFILKARFAVRLLAGACSLLARARATRWAQRRDDSRREPRVFLL